MAKRVSQHSLEFTSISELLKKHQYAYVKLLNSVVYSELFTANSTCTWFPTLSFIVCDNNNQVIHVKRKDGMWFKRNGRANGWFPIKNSIFKNYMDEKYQEYISNVIEI